ncbi:MAG: tail fiber domain-containing protein [Candidatus Marinimicrobia bacterium]|nr:tail fiber domain-containing protein [Candidatus Neomarinimicrobiota bacterium]
MKRIFLMIGLIIFAHSIYAATFPMQGVLRDPLGKTVADGYYQLSFKIYEQASGGSAIWSETQANVQVFHGAFAVELGLVAALDEAPFNTIYWIGVAIEDGAELAPRFKITGVPAAMSVYGSDKVIPAVGNTGIGTHEPNAALHIKTADAGNAQLLIEGADGSDYVKVSGAGKMGINVETPTQALDIDGNLKMRSGGIMFDDESILSSAEMGGSASSVSNQGTTLISADTDDNGSGNIDFIIGSTTIMQVDNYGSACFTGAITAPKLIDSSNEALYIDPDSSSELYILGIRGAVPSATYPLNVAGYIKANAFYDSNNPAYYLDPAGNNKLLRLGLGGAEPSTSYSLNVSGSISFYGDYYRYGQLWEPNYWQPKPHGIQTDYNVVLGTSYSSFCQLNAGYNMRIVGPNAKRFDFGAENSGISYNDSTNTWIISNADKISFKFDDDNNYTSYDDIPLDFIMDSSGFYPSIAGMGDIGLKAHYQSDYRRWYEMHVVDVYRDEVVYFSDSRVKQNISSLQGALAQIMALRGIRYQINTDTHPFYKNRELRAGEGSGFNLGFIAQELKEVIPEMVEFVEEYQLYAIRNYEQMLPVIVAALQELKVEKDTEISELETIANGILEQSDEMEQVLDNLERNRRR